MISSSATATPARFCPTVRPVSVIALVCSSSSSCFIRARAPPASSKSSMECSPLGLIAASSGTSAASRSNSR